MSTKFCCLRYTLTGEHPDGRIIDIQPTDFVNVMRSLRVVSNLYYEAYHSEIFDFDKIEKLLTLVEDNVIFGRYSSKTVKLPCTMPYGKEHVVFHVIIEEM